MKKSTKRVVSSVLAASMLFTSVAANQIMVTAENGVVAAAAFSGKITIDAETVNAACAGDTGVLDMYDFGGGITAYNAGSPWAAKTSTSGWTFTDGATYSNAFQIGKGNNGLSIDTTTGAVIDVNDGTQLEKALQVEAAGAGTITFHAAIGSSGLGQMKLLLIDANGNVLSDTAITKDEATAVITPAVIDIPAAGTYYILNPGKQSSWNVCTIDVDITGGGSVETTTEATTEAPTETTTEAPTESTTGTDVETTEATTEAPTEATTEAPASNGFVGEATIDANAVNDACAADTGVMDSYSFGGGLTAYNAGSPWAAKTNAYTFTDGTSTTGAFQVGKGNNGLSVDTTAGAVIDVNDGTQLEKALQLDAGAAGTVTIYTGIGSSGLGQMKLLLIDANGNVLSDVAVIKDAETNVLTPAEFTIPAAGTYYILNPGKQSSWNVAKIDVKLGNGGEVTTAETTTESTTAETTTEFTTETTTQFVPVAGTMYIGAKVAGSDSNVVDPATDTFDVNFDLLQNQGISSYTFYLDFDPSVVQPVQLVEPADYNYTGYVTYPITFRGQSVDTPFYIQSTVDNQIGMVVDPTNADYAGMGADGVKKASELGRVVLAAVVDASYVDANNYLQEVTGDGTLFTIRFKVVGEGDANIKIVGGSAAFAGAPVNKDKVITWAQSPSEIKVAKVEVTTTESTTETTTKAPTTESTTEPTTKAPTTESTTKAPVVTESTTESTTAVVDDTTETTTKRRSSGGGGGGSSYAASGEAKTTEATTELTTTAVVDDTTEATTSSAFAVGDVEVSIGEYAVVINGVAYDVDASAYIQAESQSTLVPLRFVALAIAGGDVADADNSEAIVWDAVNKTATIFAGNRVIVFQADSDIMVVDNTPQVMDNGVKAEIVDGRMYVPFRALGKALGVDVEWDAATKTAKFITGTVVEETTEATTEEVTDEATTEEVSAEDTTAEDVTEEATDEAVEATTEAVEVTTTEEDAE